MHPTPSSGMIGRPRSLAALALIICLASTSCVTGGGGSPNPPPAPAPIQATVVHAIALVATATHMTTQSAIAARNAGTASAADVDTILTFTGSVDVLILNMNAELRTADAWPVQQAALVQMAVNFGVGTAVAKLPPTAGVLVAALLSSITALLSALGVV